MGTTIVPQYAALPEPVRGRIANPRSGETLREFKSLRLRQSATPVITDRVYQATDIQKDGHTWEERLRLFMGQRHPAMGRTHQATGTFPRRAKGVQDPAAPPSDPLLFSHFYLLQGERLVLRLRAFFAYTVGHSQLPRSPMAPTHRQNFIIFAGNYMYRYNYRRNYYKNQTDQSAI